MKSHLTFDLCTKVNEGHKSSISTIMFKSAVNLLVLEDLRPNFVL